MRKAIAAAAAGLLLVAGQAVAANNTAITQVNDRVGARADDSDDAFAGIPFWALIGGVITLVGFIAVISDDAGDS